MNRNRVTYTCLIICFSIILVVMGNRTTEANGGLASFFKGETSVGETVSQTQGETRVREVLFQEEKDLGKMAAVFSGPRYYASGLVYLCKGAGGWY